MFNPHENLKEIRLITDKRGNLKVFLYINIYINRCYIYTDLYQLFNPHGNLKEIRLITDKRGNLKVYHRKNINIYISIYINCLIHMEI